MQRDDEAREIARGLTKAQLKAFWWLINMPHHRAGWQAGRRNVSREPVEEWTHLQVGGRRGMIRIRTADHAAIQSLFHATGSGDRMWVLNEKGLRVRAALEAMEKNDAPT